MKAPAAITAIFGASILGFASSLATGDTHGALTNGVHSALWMSLFYLGFGMLKLDGVDKHKPYEERWHSAFMLQIQLGNHYTEAASKATQMQGVLPLAALLALIAGPIGAAYTIIAPVEGLANGA